MSKVIVTEQYLRDIADAIREKRETSLEIQVKDFANEIKNIDTTPPPSPLVNLDNWDVGLYADPGELVIGNPIPTGTEEGKISTAKLEELADMIRLVGGEYGYINIDDLTALVSQMSVPSGSQTIRQNGTYNVSSKSQVVVTVPDVNTFLQNQVTDIYNNFLHSIQKYAFYNKTNLESVEFPYVTSVGMGAFEGCSSLVHVDIPQLTTGSADVFKGCTSLRIISLTGVTSLSSGFFEGCTSLKNYTYSDLYYLGDRAFKNCSSLESITYKGTSLNTQDVFYNCTALKRLTFTRIETLDLINILSYFYYPDLVIDTYTVSTFANIAQFKKLIIRKDDGLATITHPVMYEHIPEIYVPDALYNDYLNTFPWTYYTGHIHKLSDINNE